MPLELDAPETARRNDPSAVRVVVLASGSGTLLQALLDDPTPKPYRIVGVGSDLSDPMALRRAVLAGVPVFHHRLRDFVDRPAWNRAMISSCQQLGAELVVLAGFMKLLDEEFLSTFSDRVINSHPSLLPAFPGMHAPADALAYGVKVTGCTVFVVDEGVDAGRILDQQAVHVAVDDDVDRLHERIKVIERRLLVQVVRDLAKSIATGTPSKKANER